MLYGAEIHTVDISEKKELMEKVNALFEPGPLIAIVTFFALAQAGDDNLVLMQFTGFTNNGQDWYEGDILENDGDWYRVEWDAEQGIWEAAGIEDTHEIIALNEVLSSETWVQGNIYQKPELLD